MSVSISDVAREAGVSITTVSRVINGSPKVKESTRRKVMAAMEKLRYRPNVMARGLMLKESRTLGLVLPEMWGDFYSKLIQEATRKAALGGYHLIVCGTGEAADVHELYQELVATGRVDGLTAMIIRSDDKFFFESLGETRIPVVVLDRKVPDSILRDSEYQIDNIVFDNYNGAKAAVEHLIRLGHRKISFRAGSRGNSDSNSRLRAYRNCIRKHGVSSTNLGVTHGDFSYEETHRWMSDWLNGNSLEPGALFCANDQMACGVVDAIRESGKEVPRDLAVVGFDNIRVARYIRPGLTTVDMPIGQAGALAVEMMIERLAQGRRESRKVTLPTRLIVRQSCGERRHSSRSLS